VAAAGRAPAGDGGRFGFVEVEVPWALGPPDGRHVVRDPVTGSITHVVVLATQAAPERRRLTGRGRVRGRDRPDPVAAAPAAVATARATVILTARPLGDAAAARAWLRGADESMLAEGLDVLGRVLRAQRIATADPALVAVAAAQLIAARVGVGSGAELAAGRRSEIRELSVGRGAAKIRGRRRALVPAARLAALLAGRESALVCEELVLRARLDLDAGRPREAALQVLIALDAALAELPTDSAADQLATRIDELRGHREAVAAAAQAALAGDPGEDAQAAVASAVARLEAALRARAASRG
jgi:hypothetical protein